MLNSITVFCGASAGNHPDYIHATEQVGKIFAERNIRLVYGGGRVGLMGRIADAALSHGGKVTGVILSANQGNCTSGLERDHRCKNHARA
jgi:predicted Rossmann-fold nucleotide-binding protein